VVIRPGRPNLAASSWASGVFREPLHGEECVLPVTLDTRLPVAGYRTVVAGLIELHELDGARLGPDRALNFPSLSASAAEMVEALERVAGDRPLGAIGVQRDPAVEAIVNSWAPRAEAARALELSLPRDEDLDSIVRAYIEDFAPA
jgi:hypothetical protein